MCVFDSTAGVSIHRSLHALMNASSKSRTTLSVNMKDCDKF